MKPYKTVRMVNLLVKMRNVWRLMLTLSSFFRILDNSKTALKPCRTIVMPELFSGND